MDLAGTTSHNERVPIWPVRSWESPRITINMSEKRTIMSVTRHPLPIESELHRFERILLRPEFKPLKAVFDNLAVPVPLMQAAIITTNSYQLFLGKLGYRVVVVQQIHENDCYGRLGPKGGIRAVLPIHDTATYSTMVTLVNYDSTVTTTVNSIDYYDRQLADFKIRLMNRSGNAD